MLSKDYLAPIIISELSDTVSSEGNPFQGFIYGKIIAAKGVHENVARIMKTQERLIVTNPEIVELRNSTSLQILTSMQNMFPHLESNDTYRSCAQHVAYILGQTFTNQICMQHATELPHVNIDHQREMYYGSIRLGNKRPQYTAKFGEKYTQAEALQTALQKSDKISSAEAEYLAKTPNTKICQQLIQKGVVIRDKAGNYKVKNLKVKHTRRGGRKLDYDSGKVHRQRSLNIHDFDPAFQQIALAIRNQFRLTDVEFSEIKKLGIEKLYSAERKPITMKKS